MTYERKVIIRVSDYHHLYYYPSLIREEIEIAFTNGHETKIYYLLIDDTHFAFFPNSKSGCILAQYMTTLQWYYEVYDINHLQIMWKEIDDSLF